MAGGVWEWTRSDADGGIVLKGGSWYEKNPANLRAAARLVVDDVQFTSSDVGFRCVRDRESTAPEGGRGTSSSSRDSP